MRRALLFTFLMTEIFCFNIIAQQLRLNELDSLYYSVLKIRRPDLINQSIEKLSIDTSHIKCATSLFNAVRMNINFFPEPQKALLKSLLDRPTTDTSIVTTDGFFRIHYDTSSGFAPTYSVQLLSQALDSVYNFEIKFLGYPPPPSDSGAGDDNKYDIYVMGIGNVYGYTVPETEIIPGSSRYTAYTVINNDFTGFYTTGINAARVTAAHEFDHAINIGNYINRYFSGDEFFYELSATAMEHFVFSSIKDYLQYLPTYFNNTQNSIAVNSTIEEFALGIWNIYQKDRFGYDIIKDEWQLMPQMRAMDAINTALHQYGSSLGNELSNFGLWMYFTNYRTKPGQYFEDASYYPLVKSISTLNFNSQLNFQISTEPASNTFVTIVNPANADTLVTIFTNSDVQEAIDSTNSMYSLNANLYDHSVNGATSINNSYYIDYSAENISDWNIAAILNNLEVNFGIQGSITEQIGYPFPSPFVYGKDSFLYIPVPSNINSDVRFSVYTVDMHEEFSASQLPVYFNNQKVIKWNAKNSSNSELGSGIYIYTIKTEFGTTIGKLAILK
jgi:hypothetical protein